MNHETGCEQAQKMKRAGQGPTIHQADVFESTRPNPVASVDQKVVTDAPAWYVPMGIGQGSTESLPPSIQRPIPISETVDGVPVVYAPNLITGFPQESENPNEPVWYGQVDRATGLVVLPAPFHFEITDIQQEQTNESISENVLSQEQNANGLSVNQGSGEPVERVESVGSSDGGNSHDASDPSGSGDDSSSATVEQVIPITDPSVPAVITPSSVAAGDGQTEPKTTI